MNELANMKRSERAYVIVAPTGDMDNIGFHEMEAQGFVSARNAKQALRRYRDEIAGELPDGSRAVQYSRASEKMLAQARDAEAMAYGSGG